MTDPSLGDVSRKERAVRIAVITTFFSLIPTAYAAFVSNSITLYTDLLRCCVEFGAIVLAWVILRSLAKGSAKRFDYGHGKLEQASSLAVAFAMLITVMTVSFTALQRINSPEAIHDALFGFILGTLSIAGNLFMTVYYGIIARQTNSPIMNSQSRLFRSKMVASIVVTASVVPAVFYMNPAITPYVDSFGSLILASFLLYSAIKIFAASAVELIDCSLEESLQMIIVRTLIQHESEYRGFKDVKSRRSGVDIYIEIQLEFDGDLILSDVTSKSNAIVKDLQQEIPGAHITIVPVVA